MQLIDFDGLFDEKLAQYMKESGKKRSPKQWEDVIPKLYQQFGDTYIAKIKCTPKEYYAKMTDVAIVQTLSAHLEQDVPVSEFLANEIERRDLLEELLSLLNSENAETAAYAVRLIGSDPRAYDVYFSILEQEDRDEDIKSDIVAILCDNADEVKARAAEAYKKGVETECMLEILSHVTKRDELVYETLVKAFWEAEEWQLTLRAGYLATYGDERALPQLFRKIEDRSIGFVEFQELKYAIEALGGEYDEERDFTADKDYLTVQSATTGTEENK